MPCKKREPCPAGIEDKCPVPRYRCKEFGEPGKHCLELFAEFEAFALPAAEQTDEEDSDQESIERLVLEQLRALGVTEENET